MNKIMVIGVSAGAGKSTFARRLGELTGIEVTHLDRLYWKPNWVEAPSEEFSAAQQQVVQNEQWIIEGNYTGTFTYSRATCGHRYLFGTSSPCLFVSCIEAKSAIPRKNKG